MVITRDHRLLTKATPDGPAFYPFGSWGAGYLLDRRAEHRLVAWHRWHIWVQTGFITLMLPDFMPGNAGERMLVFIVVWGILSHGLYWFYVRSCPLTAVRLTAEENRRMQAEAAVHGSVGLTLFIFAPVFAFLMWQSFFAPPATRWGPIVGTIDVVVFAWGSSHAVRIGLLKRRLDRKPSTQPGLWMRKR